MELLKTATDWAKTEAFSTSTFALFGIVFLLVSIAFWQLGKTDIAKAYVIPVAIAGSLLLAIGMGLTYTNHSRTSEFQTAYNKDPAAFVELEIARTEKTLNEYRTVVFTAIPIIIAICAIMIIFFSAPTWRSSMITTITMMAIILLIDGTAHGRIEAYHEKLIAIKKDSN